MATYLVFHEVDDVEHWFNSRLREEVFGPQGITARAFRDPNGSNRVGLIVEIPDLAAYQEFMQNTLMPALPVQGGFAGGPEERTAEVAHHDTV